MNLVARPLSNALGAIAFGSKRGGSDLSYDVTPCLDGGGGGGLGKGMAVALRGTPLVAETLRSHPLPGSNALGAIAFNCTQDPISGPIAGALSDQGAAVGFALNQRREGRLQETAGAVHEPSGTQLNGALSEMGVRRLTPRECERLQGFPDGWIGRRIAAAEAMP